MHLSRAFVAAISNITVYHEHVLHFISGFVQGKLLEKSKCSDCMEYLLSSECAGQISEFTVLRDRGGLIYPHADVVTIVIETDRILRFMMATSRDCPLQAVNSVFLVRLGIAVIKAVRGNVFLPEHAVHVETQESHPVQIIKFICNLFCKTLLHHLGKLFSDRHLNSDKGSMRHSLSKKILFMHQ